MKHSVKKMKKHKHTVPDRHIVTHAPHRRPENNFWRYATFVLAVLFILSLLYPGLDFRDEATRTAENLASLMAMVDSESDRSTLNKAMTVVNSLKGKEAPKAMVKDEGKDTEPVGEGVVVIEEFSDFECPFCGRALPTVEQIKETYGDQVNIVFKHFPLGFHPNAQPAAEAAECARDQGEFWEYHDKLFENQQALNRDNYIAWATDLGLDVDKFTKCIDDGEKKEIVQSDFREGQSKGVSGTPTFFVNGQKIVGAQPFTAFKPVIDAALSGEAPAPQPEPEPPAPQPPSSVKLSIDDDPVKGEDDAPVTMIEFSDYQCPFCGRFYSQTLGQIEEEYINTGKVKLVFRDFPLSFHPEAKPSAIASECANEQGKFWEYHDLLFDNQGQLNADNYIVWADELGLDISAFEECLADPEFAAEVDADFADGGRAGNTGTPGFFIGVSSEDGNVEAVKVTGAQPFAAFKAVIDQKLAEAEE